MVFSAMNHQTVNKEFKSAAESGTAKHLETGLRNCSQIMSVGEILSVVVIITFRTVFLRSEILKTVFL